MIELLANHFAQWSFHISFPELATISIMRLKKFNERSTMEGLKRVVKRFIEQVKQPNQTNLGFEIILVLRNGFLFCVFFQGGVEY